MNVKDSIAEVKDKMLRAIDGWTSEMVDVMGESNASVSNISLYLKRGVRNMLHEKADELEDMLNNIALFVVDEDGNYDMPKFVDDVSEIVRNMDETKWELGILSGTLGKGKLRVHIPDNIVARLIFGDTGAVCFTIEDLRRMKEWM